MGRTQRNVSLLRDAAPPDSVREFAAGWKTIAFAKLWPDALLADAVSIYSQYWYRAVAAMMLGGRVAPTTEGRPNRTDGLPLCKEANFNPAWLDELAWFLVQAQVIQPARKEYIAGEALAAFDRHDFTPLRAAVCEGVVRLIRERTGNQVKRPSSVQDARLIDFLALFAAAFPGLAVHESDLDRLWYGLAELPVDDLVSWATRLGMSLSSDEVGAWHPWLDQKGIAALRQALYMSRWAYGAAHRNEIWFGLSFDAQSMLGIVAPLATEELTASLEVDETGHVFAGAGLPINTLSRLCRLCRVTRIRAVLEFQIDKKRLAQLPVSESPDTELRDLLGPAGQLPRGVEKLLGRATLRGGRVMFKHCSGVVIPENESVAKAIRQHPRLKNYLATNSPPGLLLIKPDSDPGNFVQRCLELGFEVDWR